MANKYANLVGTNKIKDEYTKINTGFDAVETDIATIKGEGWTDETIADNGSQIATIEQDLNAHKAENVTQGGGVHGLEIERGTWTPTPNRDNAVYGTRVGTYTRIGDTVFLWAKIILTSKGTSSLGTVINGHPFVPRPDNRSLRVPVACYNTTLGSGFYTVTADMGSVSINMRKIGDSIDWLGSNDITDTTEIYLSLTYEI